MTKAKEWNPGPALGYDPQFATIDTRGLPLGSQLQDIAESAEDQFTPDPRFAQLDTSSQGLGSQALKRFLKAVPDDSETLSELDKSNPALAKELRDAGLREFHYSGWLVTPARVGSKINCTATRDDETVNFVITGASDQDGLMAAVMDHLKAGEPTERELSEEDSLRLQRMAHYDPQTALAEFLRLRVPPKNSRPQNRWRTFWPSQNSNHCSERPRSKFGSGTTWKLHPRTICSTTSTSAPLAGQ